MLGSKGQTPPPPDTHKGQGGGKLTPLHHVWVKAMFFVLHMIHFLQEISTREVGAMSDPLCS